ncbi:hypothetical protein DFJ77DRAFT_427034 [Powellomyces hirtus]|nr:hypothetical protein DFJ77DRAFT_427034 [Powellomyces hirtus]
MTRNRTRISEGKDVRKPRYNYKANSQNPNGPEKPRWYNQTYLMFLALRKAGKPIPRNILIPMALQLDREISRDRGLPQLFGGKTPQNTASGILTENRDKLFVSFIPEGKKHVHFKLGYEPGNFDTALEQYNKWLDTLIKQDWPYLFSKRRREYEMTLRKKAPIPSPALPSSPVQGSAVDCKEPPPISASEMLDTDSVAKEEPQEGCSPKRKREDEKENSTQHAPKKIKEELSQEIKIEDTKHFATGPVPDAREVKARMVMEQSQAIRLAEVKDAALVFEPAPDDDIPTSLRDILEVKESTIPNAGRGMFAKRFIPAWTIIGFYFGVPMTEDEFDSLKGNLGIAGHYAHRYRLTVIDATDDSGQPYPVDNPQFYCPFHFMNEDASRVSMTFWEGHFVNQILCVSTKDIQPGEELFGNYGTAVERHWQKPAAASTPSSSRTAWGTPTPSVGTDSASPIPRNHPSEDAPSSPSPHSNPSNSSVTSAADRPVRHETPLPALMQSSPTSRASECGDYVGPKGATEGDDHADAL